MSNVWETAVLPIPVYACHYCIGSWLTERPENLVWYNGKGDIFKGGLDDVDDDGNPLEEDRYEAGFYCRVCIGWFKKQFDDSYFGPTLAAEMARRRGGHVHAD